eukprot:CAMPEP_0182570678 /NCGR_PEP_ID=MMETSP1324-20130603/10923_1 /TAXON_ID=236786 /ORGANISM="Florenciella sp., Strain RCC1587" /LENGTH=135 /DNA_ID=CAMNT_0024785097 /DNA_START=80 /DNA_END=487 /DNA_ORIENTATION=-
MSTHGIFKPVRCDMRHVMPNWGVPLAVQFHLIRDSADMRGDMDAPGRRCRWRLCLELQTTWSLLVSEGKEHPPSLLASEPLARNPLKSQPSLQADSLPKKPADHPRDPTLGPVSGCAPVPVLCREWIVTALENRS